ncbi:MULTISPECIES: hypothetical protein [Saccharopolyspora]|jgi:hypothetical protein|uniref:Uncharacterized protein n=4 Tax=Saccharopolyspora TaxID=1835 RepID=A0A4R4VWC3_9PSEU|nr:MULTISPECIES: hypothetical protein [Saccharopolyspora]MBQ0924514.1 hypothetical protein [Saccharopolyspora endophytica]TDC92574.1 hypothetical protein E1161_12635 [Saccharopolyspora aridisoli]TDD04720.1 hypothetical protein E1181_16875 [Saccharopolyspora terrae]TDD84937.1 hypothetical protein E1202_22145 [Saccharopolyspora karakumensis]
MTAPGAQYGLNDSQLQQIIEATNQSLSQMRQLNNQVQAQASSLGQANVSDSGRMLVDKFGVWAGDFSRIENELNQLNQRVMDVRNASLQAAQQAADSASGAGL